MFHDTDRPPDYASALTRKMLEFMDKIWILSGSVQRPTTNDILSETSLRLLAEAEQEIDSIRHDVEIHSLRGPMIDGGKRSYHD